MSAFDVAGIHYALCGGLAVAVHGAPRATSDIDLLVQNDDVERAVEAAASIGFTFRAAPMRFPDGMVIRRVTQVAGAHAVTLDLILATPNLEGVFASRERLDLDGRPLWVVSRTGLIEMKIAAGRPQDLADVAKLTDGDR